MKKIFVFIYCLGLAYKASTPIHHIKKKKETSATFYLGITTSWGGSALATGIIIVVQI